MGSLPLAPPGKPQMNLSECLIGISATLWESRAMNNIIKKNAVYGKIQIFLGSPYVPDYMYTLFNLILKNKNKKEKVKKKTL